MSLIVHVKEHKYARKPSEYSVWVVEPREGKEPAHIFCAHPITDPDTADVIAEAMRLYLKEHGENRLRGFQQ